MPFGFKTFVVSGTRDDTEGASKLVQELKDFMISVGWTLTEDRSDQAGADHFVVLESNGEDSNFPTFYMVVHSGNSISAPIADTINVFPSTAWDTSTHAVPSSGVRIGPTNNASPLDVDSNGNTDIWLSGDSEGLCCVSKKQGVNTYDSLFFGRANSFRPVSENPYPLYTAGVNGIAIDATPNSVDGIGGQPPKAFTGTSAILTLGPLFATSDSPYNIGAATSIYYAAPLGMWYNLGTGGPGPSLDRSGAMGTARNAWVGAGTNQSLLQASKLTASGTFGKQVYQAFTATAESLIMRIE